MRFGSRAIYLVIVSLWIKTRKKNSLFSDDRFLKKFEPLSKKERGFFWLLCLFEQLYKIVFHCVSFVKRTIGGASVPFKVLSVGNLSVGGTGKSLFVSFLIDKVCGRNAAVILRGYGRDSSSHGIAFCPLVSPYTISFFGDEALMLAQQLQVPVVVGAHRAVSAKMLETWSRINSFPVEYIVLDDSYQNYQLSKQVEILLLDARHPFENGHCLPAGPLREKDFHRADCIVLTHADEVDFDLFQNIIDFFVPSGISVFAGKHSVGALRCYDQSIATLSQRDKKFLAVAGIGSFSGFLESLKKQKIEIGSMVEYRDHHRYSASDAAFLLVEMREKGCDAIVTTMKDWQKLQIFFKDERSLFFILDVAFAFLSQDIEDDFLRHIKVCLLEIDKPFIEK